VDTEVVQEGKQAAVRCACCMRVQSSEYAECQACGAALELAQPELALQIAGRDATGALVCAPPTPGLFAALAHVESASEVLWRRRRRWRAHAWVGAGILTGATLLLGLPNSLTPVGLVRGLCLGAPLGYVFSRSSTR